MNSFQHTAFRKIQVFWYTRINGLSDSVGGQIVAISIFLKAFHAT